MRYLIKSILAITLALSLVACDKEEEIKEYEYIEPCNDTYLFYYLNDDAKDLLYKANTNEALSDAQLDLLQSKLSNLTVEDIHGNKIDLNDYADCNLVIEIVSVYCSHCKIQNTQFNEAIMNAHSELTFIEYFAVGSKEDVIEYYEENNLKEHDNVIVLFANDDLFDYVVNIGVEYTPSILCFDDGLCTWAAEGTVSLSEFDRFYNIAYGRAFNYSNLTDNEGNSIFSNRRSKSDVMSDLSDYNVAQLQLLDNDGVTEDLTYSLMGQKVDYYSLDSAVSNSDPKIDYAGYEDKDVALLYIYMTGLEETDKNCLNTINRLIDKNPELSFIVEIIEEDVSSYSKFLHYDIALNCPVITSNSSVPKAFNKIGAYNYPSVMFIEKGTMTGAYSSYSDNNDFTKAKELFIGEKSIAHLDNNSKSE